MTITFATCLWPMTPFRTRSWICVLPDPTTARVGAISLLLSLCIYANETDANQQKHNASCFVANGMSKHSRAKPAFPAKRNALFPIRSIRDVGIARARVLSARTAKLTANFGLSSRRQKRRPRLVPKVSGRPSSDEGWIYNESCRIYETDFSPEREVREKEGGWQELLSDRRKVGEREVE